MSLTYKPFSEPLHNSVKYLFLDRFRIRFFGGVVRVIFLFIRVVGIGVAFEVRIVGAGGESEGVQLVL